MKDAFGACVSACLLSQGLLALDAFKIDPLPNTDSITVKAIAADGSTAVGSSVASISLASKAYQWTADGGAKDLGHLGSFWAEAVDLSDDGTVVAGSSSTTGSYSPVVTLWVNGQIQGINVGQAAKALQVNSSGSRILAAFAQGYHPFLWDKTSGFLELTNALTPTFGIPATAIMARNGKVAFGEPFYQALDHSSYGSRAGRWNETNGWTQLSTTDGTAVAVTEDGQKALFKFPSGPRAYFLWTQEKGFVETSIPAISTAFITTDGKWIFCANPIFQPDGSVAHGVWDGDGKLVGTLRSWIGLDPSPDVSWNDVILTAVSGRNPYALAGTLNNSDFLQPSPAFLVRNFNPAGASPAPMVFSVTAEVSSDFNAWSTLTNFSISAPASLTNGFIRLKITPTTR